MTDFAPDTENRDRLIKIHELCWITGDSRSTVLRKVQSGKLPAPLKDCDSRKSTMRWWISDIKKALGAEDRNL